ncbi:MYG1 family protein [Candidatus Similichlamydia epinepheli]|uniref:MYG1 family protein n=1 Tax=Candidatus Similichlamydia epinepheli TaxID=1903953 RepID=UPI001EFEEA88|nr:MYG1 family protein [Candidatus Similichlamydia epinepheli]
MVEGKRIPNSLGTHDGTFHSDEVTACALLLICKCINRELIFRTRDPFVLDKCEYVCDVGGIFDPKEKRFDHHQIEYDGELSSCGMVLNFLEENGKLSSRHSNALRNSLVIGIDDDDCGRCNPQKGVCTFSMVISNFNALRPFTDEEQNEAFNSALDFCLGYLERFIRRQDHVLSSFEVVKKTLQESKLSLIFDESIPWMESFFLAGGEHHPAVFLVMPSHNEWHLRAIPESMEKPMSSRMLLPEYWAGLFGEEFERESKIKGGVFCHKNRFLSVWKTKKAAMEALEFVLKSEKGYTFGSE